MTRSTNDLEKLDQRMARLRNELARLGGKKSGEQRKLDTRRKIILGAALLEAADETAAYARFVADVIAELGPRDRLAFQGWTSPTPEPR